MKRLTKRWGSEPYPNLTGKVVCEYKECDSARSCENCIHGRYKDRLAAIEDILGDEYDLERLRKLWFADQKGHCVVFDERYPVVSEYYRDDEGWYIRESSGVISETEYKKVMGGLK